MHLKTENCKIDSHSLAKLWQNFEVFKNSIQHIIGRHNTQHNNIQHKDTQEKWDYLRHSA
jgi:hypothetical protein